ISKMCKRIQNEAFTVTYEETGNELIGQLKEREELLVNKLVLNVVQRKTIFTRGVYLEEQNETFKLKVGKVSGKRVAISCFKNQKSALEFVNYIEQLHLERSERASCRERVWDTKS